MPKSGLIIYIQNHSCPVISLRMSKKSEELFTFLVIHWNEYLRQVFGWKFPHIKLKRRIVIFYVNAKLFLRQAPPALMSCLQAVVLARSTALVTERIFG